MSKVYVDEPGAQALLHDVGAAGHEHVLPARGRARLREAGLDAVGDEGEREIARHRLGLAGVVREHEDRHLERRVLAPPALGVKVEPDRVIESPQVTHVRYRVA